MMSNINTVFLWKYFYNHLVGNEQAQQLFYGGFKWHKKGFISLSERDLDIEKLTTLELEGVFYTAVLGINH